MISYKLEVDLSQLNELAQHFSSGMSEAALPNTAQAFITSSRMVRNAWVDYINGDTSLDGIENLEKVNRDMALSIQEKKNKDFDYTIYSDSIEMQKISQKTEPVYYDMKQTHPYGRKSRISKKGVPYLIIPFRWGTPNDKGTKRAHFNNVIPQKNYLTSVKGLKISSTTGLTHVEPNAKGIPIDRAEYNWASRLTKDTAWDDRSIGMVRMKDVGKSTYFTFRVISAKSPSGTWLYWKDGKDGVDIIGALKRTLEPTIRKTIEEGIQSDQEMYKKQ